MDDRLCGSLPFSIDGQRNRDRVARPAFCSGSAPERRQRESGKGGKRKHTVSRSAGLRVPTNSAVLGDNCRLPFVALRRPGGPSQPPYAASSLEHHTAVVSRNSLVLCESPALAGEVTGLRRSYPGDYVLSARRSSPGVGSVLRRARP